MFDERELELLIGGIADIDVDDWKKHTDYRGYTEADEVIVNFWKVNLLHAPAVVSELTNYLSVSEDGMPSKSLGYYNSLLVPPVYQSMDSKIFKEVMVLVDLPSRKQVKLISYQSLTLGTPYTLLHVMFNSCADLICLVSTAWTCHRTVHLMSYKTSYHWPWRKPWDLGRSNFYVCIC